MMKNSLAAAVRVGGKPPMRRRRWLPAAACGALMCLAACGDPGPDPEIEVTRADLQRGFRGWSAVPANANGFLESPGICPARTSNGVDTDTMSRDERITLYFRSTDNRMYQASNVLGGSTFETFAAMDVDTFVGDPAAVSNITLEGHHIAVAKKSSNQAFVSGAHVSD